MNPPYSTRDFVVDLDGLAAATNVMPRTSRGWRTRRVTPPVDFPEVERPLWWASTLARWAVSTGRDWSWERARDAMTELARAGRIEGPAPDQYRNIGPYRSDVPALRQPDPCEWLDRRALPIWPEEAA